MCVERLRENNNIININTIEVFKLTKLFVYYSLNVDERNFELYNSNIKLFLALINNKEFFFYKTQLRIAKRKLTCLSNLYTHDYKFEL